ncbi:MAG: hypothetical protein FJ411_05565 [Verrucomicrobia bacterium]|nr:hypothetical protein [Verrucomicrobiota bacterium]
MESKGSSEEGQEGLGPELERLLAMAPPPKAPAWFASKTLGRLRQEKEKDLKPFAFRLKWRWVWAAGTAVLVGGWVLWNQPDPSVEISNAAVFAALDALVEQEHENRWWAGL